MRTDKHKPKEDKISKEKCNCVVVLQIAKMMVSFLHLAKKRSLKTSEEGLKGPQWGEKLHIASASEPSVCSQLKGKWL